MPKIIPLQLNENRQDSFMEFVDSLSKKHKGQQTIYVKPLVKILEEFQKKGPSINKDHKNFIPFKKFKGNKYDGICELRTKKCRYILYEDDSDTYIGLHGFEKKSDDTPDHELERARKEVAAWIRMKN